MLNVEYLLRFNGVAAQSSLFIDNQPVEQALNGWLASSFRQIKHMQGIEKRFPATLSKVAKKTQLSTHMLYLLQQIKHGVEPG